MPLRVIQHYSDWVCTTVMSNDVMKDLRGLVCLNNKLMSSLSQQQTIPLLLLLNQLICVVLKIKAFLLT